MAGGRRKPRGTPGVARSVRRQSALPLLYGERGQHLDASPARGVVGAAGNRLAIAGRPRRPKSHGLLSRLYDRLKRGDEIDLAAVEGGVAANGAETEDKGPPYGARGCRFPHRGARRMPRVGETTAVIRKAAMDLPGGLVYQANTQFIFSDRLSGARQDQHLSPSRCHDFAPAEKLLASRKRPAQRIRPAGRIKRCTLAAAPQFRLLCSWKGGR
jgi:hypothetical protein